MQNKPFDLSYIESKKKVLLQKGILNENETNYFVFAGEIQNNAYNPKHDKINILLKNGEVMDIAQASDQLNISVLSETVRKYFLCYPKS